MATISGAESIELSVDMLHEETVRDDRIEKWPTQDEMTNSKYKSS